MTRQPNSPRLARPALLDLLALGLLALATAAFFWRVLFAGAWMPAGGGDLASFLYPNYQFVARAFQSGTVPLWNPYLWGGTPFAADIQASISYPINLLVFWLVPHITYRGLMGLAILHFWLAGAGMYLCLRDMIGRQPEDATGRPVSSPDLAVVVPPLIGAVAYMFSDFFIVHFGNLNLIAQAAWLPFIFLFYHRALARHRLKPAIGAGLFFGIAATAGHIQPLIFITLTLVLYTVYHLALGWHRRRTFSNTTGSSLVGSLAALCITLLIGLGLAAVTLLPTLEMAGYTLRSDYSYTQASQYSLAPAQLVGLLVPGFFGRDPAVHWGAWQRVEVGYVGVLTLLLALLCLLTRRDRDTGFLALLAAVSLLIAMGGYTIVHGWLYQFIPGLGSIRAPARFVFVMGFALAGLAALGMDSLLNNHKRTRPRLGIMLRAAPWVIGAIVLFAIPLSFYAVITSQDKDPIIFARTAAAANGLVFFAGLLVASVLLLYLSYRSVLRPAIIGGLAVGLLFLDLASLGGNVDVGHEDPTRAFDHPAIISFLKSDASLYRIDTRTDIWHLWQPNTALLHGIFDVAGLVNPLSLADYDRYLNGIPHRSSPLYDFLNAKYVIAPKDVVLDWERFAPVFDADPALNVYLNQNAMPRALVVHKAIVAPDHEVAFAALHVPDFDPTTQVVLETGDGLDVTPAGAATIHVDIYQLNLIRLHVDTPADGYLVLSEVWYPGWQAQVDGQPVPVLRADYAFRAVRLPAGQHDVEMRFDPISWKVGLVISGITALGLIVWGSIQVLIPRPGKKRETESGRLGETRDL